MLAYSSDQPFVNGNIPTTAHGRLKKLILSIIESANQLPYLPLSDEQNNGIDLDDSQTYEDLLSMAVINEVSFNLKI